MKTLLKVLLATLCSLLLLEGGLRFFYDAPKGLFLRLLPSEQYLYPPNKSIPQTWATIPYLVQSNNLGFRGNDTITPHKPDNSTRIVTLGDSITDGFFVDNSDSYPFLLQQQLQTSHKQQTIEVINAAKGGGTLTKQNAIYQHYVAQLQPDIVVLTFVTNDLNELKNRPLKTLQEFKLQTSTNNLVNTLIAYTAVGETVVDLFLRFTLQQYSTAPLALIGKPERYIIPNNDNYKENALAQVALSKKWNNFVLYKPERQKSQFNLKNYLSLLKEFNKKLIKKNTQLVFVYYPSYSQIYLDTISFLIRDQLKEFCLNQGIAFHDLTPGYRQARYIQPLHLAPVDYHPNPQGNKLLANLIADFLTENYFQNAR